MVDREVVLVVGLEGIGARQFSFAKAVFRLGRKSCVVPPSLPPQWPVHTPITETLLPFKCMAPLTTLTSIITRSQPAQFTNNGALVLS